MTTYLFVTDPEKYDVESVTRSTDSLLWSCSKTVAPGDTALVYLKGGEGIAYDWEIRSDAEPNKKWRYMCDVRLLRRFSPPIPLSEICSTVSKAKWGAPHTNFRGFRSIRVPDPVAQQLRALRARKRTQP